MSANPYESPETLAEPVVKAKGWRPSFLSVVVVLGVLGVLIALLIPARRGSREAARRMQCSNHLKQIALALQTYESAYGCLPPAYTVDAEGKPLHSWRTLILPFIEANPLYDRIDLSKAWDDPANQAAAQEWPFVYRCPSSSATKNHTGYLAVVAPGGCFKPTEPRLLSEITDEKSLTLMMVEVPDDLAVHWMSPSDASEDLILNLGAAKRPVHPNVAMALFVDGHVSRLMRNTPPGVLQALISIAGNDDEAARAWD